MAWTKILSKGWKYVIQIIVVVGIVLVTTECNNRSRREIDYSIREDIDSAREIVDRVEKQTLATIDVVDGIIDTNERLISGIKQLRDENRRAISLLGEIGSDNKDHQRRVRIIQERSLESELIIDGILQDIRTIERANKYNSDKK